MLRIYATATIESASLGAIPARTAHRASFSYEPKPGFIYVRCRAISSRTNDNFDHFPAEEIKKAYRTFIGKPVFVNHHNDDHRRARGVIIDAALHEDINPDGTPDTWTELLQEIDARNFPKLARAILTGEVDRTSMGTDMEYSVCSACGNRASTPAEYCRHIPKMKGQVFTKRTASGGYEDTLIYERCYGLRFFENSILVENPADPTAFFLGVDDHSGMTVTASKVTDGLRDLSEAMHLAEKQDPRFKGVGLKQDDDGWYVTTHRARSKSYPTPEDIPQSRVDFIESTGSRTAAKPKTMYRIPFPDGTSLETASSRAITWAAVGKVGEPEPGTEHWRWNSPRDSWILLKASARRDLAEKGWRSDFGWRYKPGQPELFVGNDGMTNQPILEVQLVEVQSLSTMGAKTAFEADDPQVWEQTWRTEDFGEVDPTRHRIAPERATGPVTPYVPNYASSAEDRRRGAQDAMNGLPKPPMASEHYYEGWEDGAAMNVEMDWNRRPVVARTASVQEVQHLIGQQVRTHTNRTKSQMGIWVGLTPGRGSDHTVPFVEQTGVTFWTIATGIKRIQDGADRQFVATADGMLSGAYDVMPDVSGMSPLRFHPKDGFVFFDASSGQPLKGARRIVMGWANGGWQTFYEGGIPMSQEEYDQHISAVASSRQAALIVEAWVGLERHEFQGMAPAYQICSICDHVEWDSIHEVPKTMDIAAYRRRAASRATAKDTVQARVPEAVDTLRNDYCPLDSEECPFSPEQGVCGLCDYTSPPEYLRKPDLETAGEIDDLREQDGQADKDQAQGSDGEDGQDDEVSVDGAGQASGPDAGESTPRDEDTKSRKSPKKKSNDQRRRSVSTKQSKAIERLERVVAKQAVTIAELSKAAGIRTASVWVSWSGASYSTFVEEFPTVEAAELEMNNRLRQSYYPMWYQVNGLVYDTNPDATDNAYPMYELTFDADDDIIRSEASRKVALEADADLPSGFKEQMEKMKEKGKDSEDKPSETKDDDVTEDDKKEAVRRWREAKLRRRAADENPAQPDGYATHTAPAEPAVLTDVFADEVAADVEAKGDVSGTTDIALEVTVDPESIGGEVLPPDFGVDTDPEAPVAGTETHSVTDGKIEGEVTLVQLTDKVFGDDGTSPTTTPRQTTAGQDAVFAALRLARLRIAARLDTDPDLVVAERLVNSMDVTAMRTETATLESVMKQASSQPAPAPQAPRQPTRGRRSPSMASMGSGFSAEPPTESNTDFGGEDVALLE